MDKYLIHVGTQDLPGLLWELELFHFSFTRNVFSFTGNYEALYSVALARGASEPSAHLKRLMDKLPIQITPDYGDAFGGYIGENNKYFSALNHVVDKLDGRHLVIVDSDILLLPLFKQLFILEHDSLLAFEVNSIHRVRVPGFIRWYNQHYGTNIPVEFCVVAPSLIIRSEFAGRFLREYLAVIEAAPDIEPGNHPKRRKDFKRSATMCAKGALTAHHGYKVNYIKQFLANDMAAESRDEIVQNYANLHYYAKCKRFDKRDYATHPPFGITPPEGKYDASRFVWETIKEYEQHGRY